MPWVRRRRSGTVSPLVAASRYVTPPSSSLCMHGSLTVSDRTPVGRYKAVERVPIRCCSFAHPSSLPLLSIHCLLMHLHGCTDTCIGTCTGCTDILLAPVVLTYCLHRTAGGCSAVLSGYLGSELQGASVFEVVSKVKAANPAALYCCDPVMGHPEKGCIVAPGVRQQRGRLRGGEGGGGVRISFGATAVIAQVYRVAYPWTPAPD
jgi:hypothetical protein